MATTSSASPRNQRSPPTGARPANRSTTTYAPAAIANIPTRDADATKAPSAASAITPPRNDNPAGTIASTPGAAASHGGQFHPSNGPNRAATPTHTMETTSPLASHLAHGRTVTPPPGRRPRTTRPRGVGAAPTAAHPAPGTPATRHRPRPSTRRADPRPG